MTPFNPLKKFRRETTPDPRLPQKETDFRASIQQDSLKAQHEAVATDWDNIGPPVPPKQYSGSNTRSLSTPNYEVPEQVPTTRVGQSFQPKASPSYPGVDLSSVQSPGVAPGFGSGSLGEARRYPPISQQASSPHFSTTNLPDAGVTDSRQSNLQPQRSAEQNLANDLSKARISLQHEEFGSVGPPIKPAKFKPAKFSGPEGESYPRRDISNVISSPKSGQPFYVPPTQKIKADLEGLKAQLPTNWDDIGKPIPPRLPILNDED